MRQTILILLVAMLAASLFALAACSKPEPSAQSSPPATKSSGHAASAPIAAGTPEATPEPTAPSSPAAGKSMTGEETGPEVEPPPLPGVEKKIWPKKDGPMKEGK